ncbi:MAG TPA: ATP-binding protein [Actinomycetota bacterium]|nr:ATP-binding protein [Actinomycetota bacterium]
MKGAAPTLRAQMQVVRSFRSHPSALFEIRRFIRQLADEARLPPQAATDLLIAVSEACANSMLHTSSRTIRVAWTLHDDRAEVVVRDEGVFRRRVRMPEVEGAGGHGIPLMTALVDEIAILEGTEQEPGTQVRLVKRRRARPVDARPPSAAGA